MSEPKWTKGPWKLATSCSWRRFINYWGNPVCTPITQRSDGHPDLLFGKPEDAHLIAAAPELYKELEHLVKLLEPALNNGKSVPGLATLNGAWLALAKARGEAPDGEC